MELALKLKLEALDKKIDEVNDKLDLVLQVFYTDEEDVKKEELPTDEPLPFVDGSDNLKKKG